MNATKKVVPTSSHQDLTTGALANALANALTKAGPPPCEKHQCSLRTRCATEELACLAFVHYLETGKTVPPRTLFLDAKPVMSEGRHIQCERTAATHENYVLAFSQ